MLRLHSPVTFRVTDLANQCARFMFAPSSRSVVLWVVSIMWWGVPNNAHATTYHHPTHHNKTTKKIVQSLSHPSHIPDQSTSAAPSNPRISGRSPSTLPDANNDLEDQISTAPSPEEDPKDKMAPEYAANDRPRQSLGAVESQRKDELSGKAKWRNKDNFRIHDLLDLPEWVSLSLEDRIRYENFSTPWRGGAPSGQSFVGQSSLVNQLVLWSEIRFNEQWRAGVEFWDARAWSSPGAQTYSSSGQLTTQGYVDRLSNSTVDTGQFAQIYGAFIERDLFDRDIDSETKFGQMTMDIGSRRLIGRAAYRNTQQHYVGLEQRFREAKGDWELLVFANVPEALYPGNVTPNNYHASTATQAAMTNDVIWNRPETNAYFTGFLLTQYLDKASALDLNLYYLNEGPENILNRRLFTPGIRIYKASRKGEFNYELESIGQTGTAVVKSSTANYEANLYAPSLSYSTTDISKSSSGYLASQRVGGFFQHIHLGYTFDTDFDPRLTAQWDYGTSHFDTLYGPTVFEYGPTGIGGFFATRTNINSPGWKLECIPHRDVVIYINQRWWWLADTYSTSGWAGSGIFNSMSGKNYQGSYVGETIEVNARWDAHANIAFQAGWQILMKGNLAVYGTGAVGTNAVQNTQGGLNQGSGYGAPNDSNVNLFFTQMQVRF